MTRDDLQRILMLMITRDPRAAKEIRLLGDRLHAIADKIEQEASPNPQSTGGIGDIVRMQLVGPDGKLKHDSGAN